MITKIGSQKVNSVQDLMDFNRKITRGKEFPVPTLVEFERNLAKIITTIKIGPEAEEDQPLEAWKPWLGVSTQVLTKDLSKAFNLPDDTRGVRITQVYPETPAKEGGIMAGDLLFRIDGQIISANRQEDFEVFGNMIKEYRTDSTIRLTGIRNGKLLDLNVTLDRRPPPSNELPKIKDKTFEFTIREISFADRINSRLDSNHSGLFVENVEPASWAALGGLRQGDLLLEIEKFPVSTIEQFQFMIEKEIQRKSDTIIFFIRRGIHTLYLEIQPDWDEQ